MSEGPYGREPYPPPGRQPAPPPVQYQAPSYPPPGYPQAGYAQPGYAQPGYPPQVAGFGAAPRNGLGTAALVLGIIGVVLCWIPVTGWALNILAIIFGGVGMGRAKRGEATNKSSAVAGLILGALGLAIWVIVLIYFLAAVATVV